VLCGLADKLKLLAPVEQLETWARIILLDLRSGVDRRRFILACDRTLGMTSDLAEEGDRVCILLGCSIPVILRPISDGTHMFICDAYIDGYMFGKGISEAEAGNKRWEEFRIK
jgi:hypothetical protein